MSDTLIVPWIVIYEKMKTGVVQFIERKGKMGTCSMPNGYQYFSPFTSHLGESISPWTEGGKGLFAILPCSRIDIDMY